MYKFLFLFGLHAITMAWADKTEAVSDAKLLQTQTTSNDTSNAIENKPSLQKIHEPTVQSVQSDENGCAIPPCCFSYNPKFYHLECAAGVFLEAAFLYWNARESDLSYAQKGEFITTTPDATINGTPFANRTNFAPFKDECFDTIWKPGVEVGLGFHSSCDGWDLFLNWTYYKNSTSRMHSIAGNNILAPITGDQFFVNPWIRPVYSDSVIGELSAQVFPYYLFTSIHAKWKFTMNDVNLLLGRRFWVGSSLTLHPYMGIEGAWTHTNFSTRSIAGIPRGPLGGVTSFAGISSSLKDSFKNRFWGVGLRLGLSSDWKMGGGFSLYGDGSFSLLQGQFKRSKNENYQSTVSQATAPTALTFQTLAFNHKTGTSSCFGMQPILDFELGFRYEKDFCCCRYRLGVDIGWEQQFWFNHTSRTRYNGVIGANMGLNELPVNFAINEAYAPNFDQDTQDVSLGGLKIAVNFEF